MPTSERTTSLATTITLPSGRTIDAFPPFCRQGRSVLCGSRRVLPDTSAANDPNNAANDHSATTYKLPMQQNRNFVAARLQTYNS